MRYTPFESFDRLFDQMRRDMMEWRENMGEEWPALEGSSYGTSMDLTEHDGEYVFTADLPGFEKEAIDLRFDDGYLVLSASQEGGDESSSRRRSIHERVSLPVEVEEDGISASYHNGVLTVHLPIVEGATESGHHIDID